jgi:hypothetical protein
MAKKNDDYLDDIGTEHLGVTIGIETEGLGDLSGVEKRDQQQQIIYKKVDRKKAEAHYNPTLLIGLGGTGLKALDQLKGMMKDNSPNNEVRSGVSFLGFDCNRDDVMQCKYLQANVEAFAVTLADPKKFKENNERICEWVTQKIFPTNAEFGAGQYRQVSRMCTMHHYEMIEQELQNAIIPILPEAPQGAAVKLDIYIVTSLCGGAGSGMFLDLAVLLRDLEMDLAIEPTVFGVFVTGDVYQKYRNIPIHEHPRLLANTYACIKELQYLQDLNSEHNKSNGEPVIFKFPNRDVRLNHPPFDLVLLIQSSNRYGKPTIISKDQLNNYLSNVLYLMTSTPLSRDHKAKWVNPAHGFNKIWEWVDNAPRSFSSLGYMKFMYPEKDFINYLNGYYGELLLKYFLDSFTLEISQEEKFDPRKVSIKDHIETYVEKKVDENFEMEDLLAKFSETINYFRFNKDDIYNASVETSEQEDWETIPETLENFENDLLKSLEDRKRDIENGIKDIVYDFELFMNSLPVIMLESEIGVRHMLQFLNVLVEEFDEEESLCIQELENLEIHKQQNQSEWSAQKEEIIALIKDKPFLLKRKKLNARLEVYATELSEYLNNRLKEELLEGILECYHEMDRIINQRSRIAQKIVGKFDSALRMYQDHKRRYQIRLNSIAGEKKAYAYHMEFSVLKLDKLEKLSEKMLEKYPPRKTMMQLFGRLEDEEESYQFWSYRDPRISAKEIIQYIQNDINSFFDPYRMSLSQVSDSMNVSKNDVYSELQKLISSAKAQWTVADYKASIRPVEDVTKAFPKDYNLEKSKDNAESTSDRMIEVLKIEYAMPAQLLKSIYSWKRNYDNIGKDPKQSESLHIIPDADSWPEVDTFPSKEDMMKLFALGLAYGHVYEPTQEEREKLDEKYGHKGYRGFIFRSGTWFILMPFFSLPPHTYDMKDSIIKLGQNRMSAYREFAKHPEYAEIVTQWIEDRIINHYDINVIKNKLKDYMDDVLDKEKSDKGGAQVNKEIKHITEYIETANKYKTLTP